MNYLGLFALVSSVAAFAVSQKQLSRKSVTVRWAALGIFAVLSLPPILFAVYYLHVLPEKAWFYTLRSWSGSEFFVIFLGAAGGALASLLPRRVLVLPLLFAFGIGLIPYLKQAINPLDTRQLQNRWEGDSCLQSTDSTCGPASTATILRNLGVDATEREIARAAFSTASGTEAWYLARYVRSRGLDARFDFQPTFSASAQFPAMVGVRIGGFGHFVAVLDVSDGRVTYADPLSGKMRLPIGDFLNRYEFTGFHMSVTSR
ncbi:MAG: cysteine peptidase family C39 domain-containing protein [Luteolibacter sp.]